MFVCYYSSAEATTAIKEINEKMLDRMSLFMALSKSKEVWNDGGEDEEQPAYHAQAVSTQGYTEGAATVYVTPFDCISVYQQSMCYNSYMTASQTEYLYSKLCTIRELGFSRHISMTEPYDL